MPWQHYWELETDCLNLAAKEILYRLLAFCSCHPVFNTTAPADYDDPLMLRHNAVGPHIHNNAVKRTRMLSTFMCNNPRWLGKTGSATCVLNEMLKEVDNCKDDKVTDCATFMRPRCISERCNKTSEWLGEQV